MVEAYCRRLGRPGAEPGTLLTDCRFGIRDTSTAKPQPKTSKDPSYISPLGRREERGLVRKSFVERGFRPGRPLSAVFGAVTQRFGIDDTGQLAIKII